MKITPKNKEQKGHKQVTILGIKVDSTSAPELLTLIQEKLAKKAKFYIVTPNPEIILQAQSDPELAHSLNSADLSVPDGIGLKLADKSLVIIKGRELFMNLLQIANEKKLKVYLLGATSAVNKKSINILMSHYPNIIAKGSSGPKLNKRAEPETEVDTKLESEIVRDINNFKPDLLFVAFGAPKQEIWISKWLPELKVLGATAVGGSFDYFAGFVRPVPSLIAKLNLEWLWRIIEEPKRIKRIINATIIFPLTVFFLQKSSDK